MKLIFLDIDGVLNNDKTVTKSPDGFVGISDSLGKKLRKIIEKTKAKVVLTSTWKNSSSSQDLAYMRKRLSRYLALPIGQTYEERPSLRGTGINEYLKEHSCDEFVILDDFDFNFYEEGLWEHVVLTNPIVGLTNEDVENAIKILNGDLSSNEHAQINEWGYHK